MDEDFGWGVAEDDSPAPAPEPPGLPEDGDNDGWGVPTPEPAGAPAAEESAAAEYTEGGEEGGGWGEDPQPQEEPQPADPIEEASPGAAAAASDDDDNAAGAGGGGDGGGGGGGGDDDNGDGGGYGVSSADEAPPADEPPRGDTVEILTGPPADQLEHAAATNDDLDAPISPADLTRGGGEPPDTPAAAAAAAAAADSPFPPERPATVSPRPESRISVPEDTIVATFVDGPIGIKFNHEGEVVAIKQDTQACQVPGLMKDDRLVQVGDTNVEGQTLKQVMQVVAANPRPVDFVFKRHRNWDRGYNGLPEIDLEMLGILFNSHDTLGDGSLDAIGFANLMREVHDMAVAYQGRQPEPLEDVMEHAQDLIDAHDENDDGRLDLEELTAWLEKGLAMSLEERQAYSERGGYCPDSARFIEDVAHGLHVPADRSADTAAGKTGEEPGEAGAPAENEILEEEGQGGPPVLEEVEEQEEAMTPAPATPPPPSRQTTTTTTTKKKKKKKKSPTGPLADVVNWQSFARGKRLPALVLRAVKALSAGPTQEHLGASTFLLETAVQLMCEADDDVMWATIIEAVLSGVSVEDMDANELLDGPLVHIDRERGVALIKSLHIEDSDVHDRLIAEAVACHSERARLVNMVGAAEANAMPREFELMAQMGVSPDVDDKHRNSLSAMVQRLSLTLESERIQNIQTALEAVETWAQLADLLEAVVAFKPCETLMAAATGEGLHFKDKHRVEALKDHVRCSRMMPQTPGLYQDLEDKLEAADSSYVLCDVLMLVIGRFGEMLIQLKESRQETTAQVINATHYAEQVTARYAAARATRSDQDGLIEPTNPRIRPRTELRGLGSLLAGTMTAADFNVTTGRRVVRRSPTPPEFTPVPGGGGGGGGGGGRGRGFAPPRPPPLHPGQPPQPPPGPPLVRLPSTLRQSLILAVQKTSALSASDQWACPGDDTRKLAVDLLERACVTAAGAAKLLLVALHPRLDDAQKLETMPAACLASVDTDTDKISAGEQRLLKSIVRCVMDANAPASSTGLGVLGGSGGGVGWPAQAAALRAVQTATAKKDVAEIIQVMVHTCTQQQLPTLLKPYRTPPGSSRRRRQRRGNDSRAAKRGADFFDGRDSRADRQMVEVRPTTGGKAGDRAEVEVEEGEEGGSAKRPLTMQPSPPPGPPRGPPGPKAMRGARGLGSIRSVKKKKREPGPPRALGSYMGSRTMWSGAEAPLEQ